MAHFGLSFQTAALKWPSLRLVRRLVRRDLEMAGRVDGRGWGVALALAFRDTVYPVPGQCTRLSGLSNN